ncbi:MAG: TetR/AcrR family transcriptional regulator [Nitrospirae bacterium]|nr:TetR/AcrR family transcriptional regulator [Nitrospirota bacterium]
MSVEVRKRIVKRRTGDESKQNILRAACDVFAERGYEKASIREVAKRAHISIGGIYLYFPNKQQLYTGLMKSQMDEFLDRIGALCAEGPEAALRKLIDLYMELAVTKTKMLSTGVKEYDLEFKRPIRDSFFKAQHSIITDILKKGMQGGTWRSMDCPGTALMILVTLRGAILGYLTGDIKRPKAYGRSLYEFFLNGIRSNQNG